MPVDLVNIIDERAQTAEFELINGGRLDFHDEQLWPGPPLAGQLGYWESNFASLLLVQLPDAIADEARGVAKDAELYLDAALVRREAKGVVIDGYLVLALEKMNDELDAFISEVERDTRFVRKHVVYKNSEGWQRYERITPLGLSSVINEVQSSEFEPENDASRELLEALSTFGSKELAKLHGKEWNLNE